MRLKKIFIAVGANLGERKRQIDLAFKALGETSGIHSVKMSPLYETEPVGGPAAQGKYLNGVIEIETDLSPQDLLARLLEIEKSLGRERSLKNAPRTMDLDLLFYGDKIMEEPGLRIPHPRLHERTFVLKPLADLAPDFVHPLLKKTVKSMLKDLNPYENS